MVTWMVIASLIIVGLLVVLVEIIFIPGTTVIGILGLIMIVFGIGYTFKEYGGNIGWMVTGGTAVLSGLLFYLAFRADSWKRFSLRSSVDGKVNEGDLNDVEIGQAGLTRSVLRPVGKVELNGKSHEGRTLGQYLEAGVKVRVIQIRDNQIIVEPLMN